MVLCSKQSSLFSFYAQHSGGKLGSMLYNYFCCNWTAVKLQQDFDALCEMLSEFSSGHICACY